MSHRRSRSDYSALYLRFGLGLILVGWFFSRRFTVVFFNMINPIFTLIIWYIVYGLFVYFVFHGMSFLGRRFGVKEAILVVMLTFAFLIVFNQVESPYAAIAIGKSPEDVPPLLYATEDGVTFMFYGYLIKGLQFPMFCIPFTNYCAWSHWWDLARDLTYVFTPALIITISFLVFGSATAGKMASRVVR
ncbi:MAG: hypothetical protein QXQ33_00575 [Nitrososphaerota archaeon]